MTLFIIGKWNVSYLCVELENKYVLIKMGQILIKNNESVC